MSVDDPKTTSMVIDLSSAEPFVPEMSFAEMLERLWPRCPECGTPCHWDPLAVEQPDFHELACDCDVLPPSRFLIEGGVSYCDLGELTTCPVCASPCTDLVPCSGGWRHESFEVAR